MSEKAAEAVPATAFRLSQRDVQTTGVTLPDFPWLRCDSGQLCYNEAFIGERYLLAGFSAMGRPMSRAQVWKRCKPPEPGTPFHARERWQCAFQLEVDGQLLDDGWQWIDGREVNAARAGSRQFAVRLQHARLPLQVTLQTRLDGTPFLVRWLEVRNLGRLPATISEACTWSGLLWGAGFGLHKPNRAPHPFSLGRFQLSSWGHEGSFGWSPIAPGTTRLDAAEGRSGWSAPLLLLRNESTGETAVGHLAWSGNWAIDLLNDDKPRLDARTAELYLKAGLNGSAPLRVLLAEETAVLPEFHFGVHFGDLDACAQQWHEHLRRSVLLPLPAGTVSPVECNHTGYTGNAQVTEECLFREVDVAAEIGAELFIIDAGWYGDARRRWWEQVGDWQETPLLKKGLKSTFAHIRSKGMKCGLWVEAERMAATSMLAQAHPDWFMLRHGQPIHQLDLANPAVEQHVFDTIARLVEQYELDCYRLDYNFGPGEGAQRHTGSGERKIVENTQWRYYDALYRIFDKLRARFPGIWLENCAGGGGRTDMGMMSRFHWTQVTDNWEPQNALKIVSGMGILLPPETNMTLLGAINDGVSDLDFMLRIGLLGHFCVSGVYPSPEERHLPSIARWKHTIGLYKSFVRPFLHQSRLYHHTDICSQLEAGKWCALELASEDRSRACIGIWRLPEAREPELRVCPRGLDCSRRYRLTYDNSRCMREVDGGALLDTGLAIPLRATGTSELLLLEAL